MHDIPRVAAALEHSGRCNGDSCGAGPAQSVDMKGWMSHKELHNGAQACKQT